VADAAAERRRLRESRDGTARRTSMRDVLVGVAEQEADVSLVTVGGRSHRVRVTAVGPEVVTASTGAGRLLVLGVKAIAGVVTQRGGRAAGWADDAATADAAESRTVDTDRTIADFLTQWVADRPRCTTWWGGEQLSGTLIAVGRDLATVSLEGGAGTAYVRLDSTTEMSLSVSSSL